MTISSKRTLDFDQAPPNLAQKLNQVVFPSQVTQSPFVSTQRTTGPMVNTPISQMMELRSWQQAKILGTYVHSD